MKSLDREFMRRIGKMVLAVSLVAMMSAFRNTDVETNTYAGYEGYQFDAVFVQIPIDNAYFTDIVSEKLAKQFKTMKIQMYTDDDLFSPFQSWTDEQKETVLAQHGVDATIVISVDSISKQVGPEMTFYNGSVYNGMVTGTATQVRKMSEQATFHLTLIDKDSSGLVWSGILDTRGNGTLFVGDKSTAKAVAKHLMKSLQASGHLPK